MGIRFAPSPTGTFHIGNLRTAWISWEWSRALGLPWVVRFEDIDAPRSAPGARESQLEDMRSLGMIPGEILTQSDRFPRHREAFAHAVSARQVYPCVCSRKDIRAALERAASAPHETPALYDGHCRNLSSIPPHSLPTIAWRFRARDESGHGDFIIGRTSAQLSPTGVPLEMESFLPAYHWACAVDDHDGGYALLVRASDLRPAALLQREIQAWLCSREGRAFLPSAVFHCALVVQEDGHRLEKRTRGVTLGELAAAGVGPGEVLRRFRTSFDIEAYRSVYAPGILFGEGRETLTLRELGL